MAELCSRGNRWEIMSSVNKWGDRRWTRETGKKTKPFRSAKQKLSNRKWWTPGISIQGKLFKWLFLYLLASIQKLNFNWSDREHVLLECFALHAFSHPSCNFHKMLHRYLVLNSHAQLKHLKQISVMNSCFQPQKIFRALFPSLSFNGRFNVLLFVLWKMYWLR